MGLRGRKPLPPENMEAPILVTVARLAHIYSVTVKTIHEWIKAGMPVYGKSQYNLADIVPWKLERDEDGSNIAADDKTRYWAAKADNEEIKRDTAKNELIRRADILPEWAARVGEVKQGLESLKTTLPPLLEGKPRDDMRDIIDKHIRRLCDSYARHGKYTPKIDEQAPKKPVKKPIKRGKK